MHVSNRLVCHSLSPSLVVDCQFLDNVQVLNHLTELLEADLSIEIFVCLDDSAVHKLLELDIVQVASNHHLEYCEEFTVGDVTIIVNIIDLECKSKFLVVACPC